MSQTVQLFKKEDLGMVRILGDKDNPLFCLKDVCEILEHTNSTMLKDSIIKEFGDDLNFRQNTKSNLYHRATTLFCINAFRQTKS